MLQALSLALLIPLSLCQSGCNTCGSSYDTEKQIAKDAPFPPLTNSHSISPSKFHPASNPMSDNASARPIRSVRKHEAKMNPSSSSYLYPGSPPAISLSSPNTVTIASPPIFRKAKTSSTNNNSRESEWSLSRILKFFSRAIPDSSESSSTQIETTTQIPEPEVAETLETTQSSEPQVEPRGDETESGEVETPYAPLNNAQISEIIIRQPEGQPENDMFKLLAHSPKAMAKTTQSLLKALYDVAPEFVNSQDFVIKFERAGEDNDKVKKI